MRNEVRDGGPSRVWNSPEPECGSVTDPVEDRESCGSDSVLVESDTESKPNINNTCQDTTPDTVDTEALHMSDSKLGEEGTSNQTEGRVLRQSTRANARPRDHGRMQSRCPPSLDEYGFLCDDDDLEYPKCHDYFKG